VTTEGRKLTEFIQDIQNLSRDIAGLLETADGLMEKAGWSSNSGTRATAELSQSLKTHGLWYAPQFFRFYEHLTKKNRLAFVSVLLFDYHGNFNGFEQPLVTVGWFDYGDKTVGDDWEYYYARFHAWIKDRQDDGTIYKTTPAKDWPNHATKYRFITAHTAGLPLVAVRNEQDLSGGLIQPILDSM